MRRAATAVAGAVLVLLAVALFVRPGKVPGDPGDVPSATGRDIPATLHLVAAGTSLTSRGFWPDDLGARLGRCLGVPVVVDRVAKAGANSDWGLAQVPGIVALSPDLVLIEFAINDADMLDGVALERSRGNLRAIIAGVRDSRPEALMQQVLATMKAKSSAAMWEALGPVVETLVASVRQSVFGPDCGDADGEDGVERRPTAFETPIALQWNEIRRRHRPGPRADTAGASPRFGAQQHVAGRGRVDDVGGAEVDGTGVFDLDGRHQEPHQIVDVQHVLRPGHRSIEQARDGAGDQRVDPSADRCRDPHHQAGRPAAGHEFLGLPPRRRRQQRQRREHQSGATAGRGVTDPNHIGLPQRVRTGQLDHHVGVGGQGAHDWVIKTGAGETHLGIEVAVSPLGDPRYVMARCQQATGQCAPQRTGDLRDQDPHTRPYFPPPLRRG